jgi:hypothetical protein
LHRIDQFSITRLGATVRALPRPCGSARRRLGIVGLALGILALAAAPGAAQPRTAGATGAGVAKPAAGPGPLLAVVSIARQRVSVYGASGLVMQSPVSTGMRGYGTPAGVFSVLEKQRYHESNIYSGAPMPYMQRLTWSGVALHAGVLPGYPASHGCIRLPNRQAVELWGLTRVGTRVVVARDDVPVLPIEDARLPAPRLVPASEDAARPGEEAAAPGPELTSAVGLRVTDASDEAAGRAVRLVDPLQRVKAARAAAVRDAALKARDARLAAGTAAAKAAQARGGAVALHNAEAALAAAQRRYEIAARTAARAAGTPAAERAGEALAGVQERLDEAQRAADAARLIAAVLRQDSAEAAAAAEDAEALRRDAHAAANATQRAAEPISIFVSRKAGRVFIRQAGNPVHEAPVRFLDDGPPLGTHVYLALGTADDGGAMRWLSVSLPSSASAASRRHGRHAKRTDEPAVAAAARGAAHETAAGALARFELPEATRRFIADRLWAGASLIVSDLGPSGETGAGTDFIVLTR